LFNGCPERGRGEEVLNDLSPPPKPIWVAVIVEDFCIPPWSRAILVEPLSNMNPIIFVTLGCKSMKFPRLNT